MGILPNNENLTDEMVEILKDIQQKYVPVNHQDDKVVLQQTAFAGDQLTAARARKSQTVRVNSKSPTDAFRGLAPFAADWHAKVNFMEVRFDRGYVYTNVCDCIVVKTILENMSLLPSLLL